MVATSAGHQLLRALLRTLLLVFLALPGASADASVDTAATTSATTSAATAADAATADEAALTSTLGDAKGSNPFCRGWAEAGECIRNPHFMFATCRHECQTTVYLDTESECVHWSHAGECERNAPFMVARCNASCAKEAEASLHAKRPARRANPHRSVVRLWTFVPVFLGLVALGFGVAVGTIYLEEQIKLSQTVLEDASGRWAVWLRRKAPQLAPYVLDIKTNSVVRVLICCYFLNEAARVIQTNSFLASLFFFLDSDGLWSGTSIGLVDLVDLAGGVAALLCALNIRPVACASVMLADTVVDAASLATSILRNWIYGRGLYINELMAKKFSMLGCVGMLIAVIVSAKQTKRKSFPGLLMEATQLPAGLSEALLAGRLFIAFLFLFVGLAELHRLLFEPFTPYQPGDGHDAVWPKAVELLLAIPFTLGWKTSLVSQLLAFSLCLEALTVWTFWSNGGLEGSQHAFSHKRRMMHYREHFMTNVATAGGLLLLQKLGGGRFTVDELMKKQD